MTLPADSPEGTKHCGPLRREPDGSWFYDAQFLGRDGDPVTSIRHEMERTAGLVAIALAHGLDTACHEMRTNGQLIATKKAQLLLRRFACWQATGRWMLG